MLFCLEISNDAKFKISRPELLNIFTKANALAVLVVGPPVNCNLCNLSLYVKSILHMYLGTKTAAFDE